MRDKPRKNGIGEGGNREEGAAAHPGPSPEAGEAGFGEADAAEARGRAAGASVEQASAETATAEQDAAQQATEEPETAEQAGTETHEEVVLAEDQVAREDGLIRDLEELQDRHLRLAAEFENYRKRTRRELAEMRRRSQAELVRGLLDVLDDLSRVAHAAPDATVESLVDGVSLVELKMRKELGDAGLERIEAAGQPFDPNLHEALAARPTELPEEDEIVSSVLVDGYTFGEILVRPARVEVMKYAPPSAEDTEGED